MLSVKTFSTYLFFFLSVFAFSQEGELNGTIKFDNKEPALGTYIILKSATFQKEANADINGNYIFKNIPYGEYIIEFSSLNSKVKIINVIIDTPKKNLNTALVYTTYQDLEEIKIDAKTLKRKIEDKGFAVNVIETKEASIRNIQTNDLLNTSAGVKIRQNGGLGSNVEYSLNGLSGNSVRIFIDGIPISMYGNSFNLNSIPASMIKNIEVYKGVVPGHLADDALGGAINIVLHNTSKNYLNVSASYGSFNTFQTNVNGLYRSEKSGFTVKASAFHNYSDNDYKVSGRSVVVTGLGGVQTPITARRFNDAYRSTGGVGQVGFTNVKWADQFFVGVTVSDDYKEVQHGAFMTITPYKDRFLESNALLSTLNYKKKDLFTEGLDIDVNALYGKRDRDINDTLAAAYSWNGDRAIDYLGNEYEYTWGSQQEGGPTLAKIERQVASVRTGIAYTINEHHKVLFNHAYSSIEREDSDPLKTVLENTFMGTRDLYKNIYALTYELSAVNNQLKTSIFGKYYNQKTLSIDPEITTDSEGNNTVVDEIVRANNKYEGYGFAASYAIIPTVTLLTSAEKAIRLPNETEVFGNDGDNVIANPSLDPEVSNNFNLGFRFGKFKFKKHSFTLSTNVFLRDIKDRIGLPIETSLNVDDELILYVNQGNAKSKGIDAQFNYTYNNNFGFNFNVSRFDLTSETTSGTEFDIPNTPFFTMNSSLRYSFKNLIQKKSLLNVFYSVYFTDDFSYLVSQGSNTVGDDFFKIPEQLVQDFGVTYSFPNKKLVMSLDFKNIFDKPVYDNLSVQKPGRALYFKLNYTINKF